MHRESVSEIRRKYPRIDAGLALWVGEVDGKGGGVGKPGRSVFHDGIVMRRVTGGSRGEADRWRWTVQRSSVTPFYWANIGTHEVTGGGIAGACGSQVDVRPAIRSFNDR